MSEFNTKVSCSISVLIFLVVFIVFCHIYSFSVSDVRGEIHSNPPRLLCSAVVLVMSDCLLSATATSASLSNIQFDLSPPLLCFYIF